MKHLEPAGLVSPVTRALEPRLLAAIDAKAKPIGSLGRIETIAIHIGLVTDRCSPALARPRSLFLRATTGSCRRA